MKRTGLHRLMCPAECGSTVYQTYAAIERGPRPFCGCSAGRMIPEHPDLAALVLTESELAAHPWIAEFRRQSSSVLHGQAPHIQRGRAVRSDIVIAGERVTDAMREEARARQLSGLRQYQAAAATSADIPF